MKSTFQKTRNLLFILLLITFTVIGVYKLLQLYGNKDHFNIELPLEPNNIKTIYLSMPGSNYVKPHGKDEKFIQNNILINLSKNDRYSDQKYLPIQSMALKIHFKNGSRKDILIGKFGWRVIGADEKIPLPKQWGTAYYFKNRRVLDDAFWNKAYRLFGRFRDRNTLYQNTLGTSKMD